MCNFSVQMFVYIKPHPSTPHPTRPGVVYEFVVFYAELFRVL